MEIRKKAPVIRERKERFSPLTIIMLVVLCIYCFLLFTLIGWALSKAILNAQQYALWEEKFEFYTGPIIMLKGGGNFAYFMSNMTQSKTIEGVGKVIYDFWDMTLNSVLYAIGGAFVNTFVQCITAYMCARYAYKLSGVIYGAVIVSMILPVVGSLPSEIRMAQMLGLYDKIWGVWIMKANFLGLYFLVFHEMFKAMPMAYSEAATIDGANDWQILWKIGFPLAKNTFLTVLLINAVALWNDYQISMVYLPNHPTLAECMHYLRTCSQDYFNYLPVKLAGPFILMMPVLILFLCFQKRLMGNLTIGGVKG